MMRIMIEMKWFLTMLIMMYQDVIVMIVTISGIMEGSQGDGQNDDDDEWDSSDEVRHDNEGRGINDGNRNAGNEDKGRRDSANDNGGGFSSRSS